MVSRDIVRRGTRGTQRRRNRSGRIQRIRPPFALVTFVDLEADVLQSLRRLDASPFVESSMARRVIYDVATGQVAGVCA
jgi:hypothetical protein